MAGGQTISAQNGGVVAGSPMQSPSAKMQKQNSDMASTTSSEVSEIPQPIERANVPAFLELYGYAASSASEWAESSVPQLTLRVNGHEKASGHVLYQIEGELARAGRWHAPYLRWRTCIRLSLLRQCLHDPVKQELGARYNERFVEAHFAHHGTAGKNMPGTSERLDIWSARLAHSANQMEVPPLMVATILRVLQAPEPSAEALAADADDAAAAGTDDQGTAASR